MPAGPPWQGGPHPKPPEAVSTAPWREGRFAGVTKCFERSRVLGLGGWAPISHRGPSKSRGGGGDEGQTEEGKQLGWRAGRRGSSCGPWIPPWSLWEGPVQPAPGLAPRRPSWDTSPPDSDRTGLCCLLPLPLLQLPRETALFPFLHPPVPTSHVS